MNPCCADPQNRQDGPGVRGLAGIAGADGNLPPDVEVTHCTVCSCRHVEATIDPGSLGLTGSALQQQMSEPLGNNVAGGGADNNDTGVVAIGGGGFKTRGEGACGSMWFNFGGLTGTGTRSQKVRGVLYTDLPGQDSASLILAGVTDEITISDVGTPSNGTWVELAGWTNFGGAPILSAYQRYWFGLWWGTQVGVCRVTLNQILNYGLGRQAFQSGVTYSSTANPNVTAWSIGVVTHCYSMYVDYTPAGQVEENDLACFPGHRLRGYSI